MNERITFHTKIIDNPVLFFRLEGITLVFVLVLISSSPLAAENIVLRESYAGNLSFALTGNTMRSAFNDCYQLNNSSASITIPSGSNVVDAVLYWSGSGSTDNTVTLNNEPVNADTSYTETVDGNVFYSARADVTNRISGSGSFTISDLSFDDSYAYCNNGQAYGGWALLVIYENSAEPLRVVNLFEGFRNFWGSSINLTPNNFVIADNPQSKGGKHAHITWEGDEGNSQSSNGSSERLTFNGSILFDSANPTNNQFNSYSNSVGRTTSGVDLDVYNIGNYLTAGATSVTTTYSTGQDRVFLSAEIISVPNRAVSDLSPVVVEAPAVFANQVSNVQLRINNAGPSTASAGAALTMTLPSGLSFTGNTGANWNCTNNAQNLSCIYNSSLAKNAVSAPLNLAIATTPVALGNNNWAVTVNGIEFDNRLQNNTTTINLQVDKPDLSLSEKLAVDQSGGLVNAGDVIRYVIQVKEASGRAVQGLSVSDTLETTFNLVSLVSSPTGSNAVLNGNTLTVNNLSLAANETASIIVDAVIASDTADNTAINNTALLSVGYDSALAISAPQLIVSQPTYDSAGNKPLYLGPVNGTTGNMARITTAGANSSVFLPQDTEFRWSLNPLLRAPLVLDNNAAGIRAALTLRHDRRRNGSLGYLRRDHDITLRVLHNNSEIARLDTHRILPADEVAETIEFTLPFSRSNLSFAAGDSLEFSLTHDLIDVPENNGQPDGMYVELGNSMSSSRIILPALTVIEVENIRFFDAPWGDSNRQELTRSNLNQALFINAQVVDPFGNFDITGASAKILDNANKQLAATSNMNIVATPDDARKIFEYRYDIPAVNVNEGFWKVQVVAREGNENDITHQRQQTIEVRQLYPNVSLTKTASVINDPVNGSGNPKAIPGAEVTYQIQVINSGEGEADSNTLIIDEQIPATTSLYVADFNGAGPAEFIQGAANSGLTYGFSALNAANDDLDFSNDTDSSDGITYGYVPQPDAEGYDANVTYIRFMPKGTLNPASGSSQPEFKFRYKVKVQ